jgi:23S rRNA (adenine2503-C2)-methyltransferase
MTSLTGQTLSGLQLRVKELGMPSYSAGQIAKWLYQKKVCSFEDMTDISLVYRKKLAENFEVGRNVPVRVQKSNDGTKKYLFPAADGKFIETVFIPDKERATLCVSSQVGCKMNCRFCMTGKQGFTAQLSASEIMNQILSVEETDALTNIVFMGMGEPFDNTKEVLAALEILVSGYGFAWSPKRITVSTVGLVPGLKRFLDESQCHLAISIHSPFHEERQKLIPAEKAFPVAQTVELLKKYDFSHQRRISFEYIMFGGMNDSAEHASALARMTGGLECRVNLIRYHAIPGVDLPQTDESRMTVFRDVLSSRGITATVRASRGEDIMAACGMLSTDSVMKIHRQSHSDSGRINGIERH